MSSPEALATVTETLQYLMRSAAEQENVTAKPPSVARNGESDEQLNIFLYSVHYNPAFRNEPMPGKARNGEPTFPPMPLILKYLITAYGSEDKDIEGQKVMGKAMSILHDHPILSRTELESITPNSGLHQQFERIRITPDTLSLDDMSKLWTTFQSAEYRLSVGYEVSVVLIESSRVGRAPLPVLKRGSEDRGAHVLPGSQPSLSGLRFPHQKPAAELGRTIQPGDIVKPGDIVTLLGEHLTLENTKVRFSHPLFDDNEYSYLDPVGKGAEMTVQLPQIEDAAQEGEKWLAGFYSLCLQIQYPVPGTDPNNPDLLEWTSNQLSIPLAPTLLSVAPLTVQASVAFELTITCTPPIRPEQKTVLLFSDQIIPYDSLEEGAVTLTDPIPRSILKFTVEEMPAKPEPYTVVVRLRVDGVDSFPVDFSENPADPSDIPPRFAVYQQVTVS